MSDLTDREKEYLSALPQDSYTSWADACDVGKTTIQSVVERLRKRDSVTLKKLDGQWVNISDQPPDLADTDADGPGPADNSDADDEDEDEDVLLPGFEDVPVDGEPDPNDLTEREEYLIGELQTGATVTGLAEDIGERETVITQHLRDIKRQGWQVYIDETADQVAIEGDQLLRSTEHKGTRTRKANRWWQLRHNELVREFESLRTPSAELNATTGSEDWVTHLTDLHAGDRVRSDDGTVIYETSELPDIIDYVTEQSLSLADKHTYSYDAAHLLWGGDMVTNEGIYEGQFEDLDAWLDEQHETLVAPLLRQLKAFSAEFPVVQVITMVGNHGQHRASGTSRQANADLILYKHIRNTVAQLREHGDLLENVHLRIGDAAPYRNFEMRGGELTGHLRHGQHRHPQAETSARKKEWLSTLLDHEFDIACLGHHHISGRIPWGGPPIICSPSPKPSGEFVEKIGERTPGENQGVATTFGVSDDGITAVFPVDTRNYS
jgi:hypothetical protein